MINVDLTNLEAKRISELVSSHTRELEHSISEMSDRKNFSTVQKIILERTMGKNYFKVSNHIKQAKRKIKANMRIIKKLGVKK